MIDEVAHLSHIKSICDASDEYGNSNILSNNKRLNFGVSQKLLNLHLMYLWCLGEIPTPPHFPVDRLIQNKLNRVPKRNGIKSRKVTAWTNITTDSEYMQVIDFAKLVNQVLGYTSLADLELHLFDRKGV